MKIKNLFVSSIIGLTFASLGAGAFTANASSWKNGEPSFMKSSFNKPWISNKKSFKGTDVNGKPFYNRTLLLTNKNQIGIGYRGYYNNGKIDENTGGSGYPILPTPYYKTTGKNSYLIKTKTSEGNIKGQARVKKIGKNIKVWINDDAKHWKYYGEFKKASMSAIDKKDPFK